MQIYTLGGGCWVRPTESIKQYWYRNSIYGTFQPFIENNFPPLELFNGELFEKFKNNRNISLIEPKNYNTLNLCIKNVGIIHHIQKSINKVNYFKFMDKNDDSYKCFIDMSHNFFYIICFQRSYGSVTNKQLLDFEKFLIENDYNLDNFIYLDVCYNNITFDNKIYYMCNNLYQGHEEDRFKNTRIKHFIRPFLNKYGMENNVWKNTLSFLNDGGDKYILSKILK